MELIKTTPKIARAVAEYQAEGGLFFLKIHSSKPANNGVEPIEITLASATPISKTELKKRIWNSQMQNAKVNRLSHGQFLRDMLILLTRHHMKRHTAAMIIRNPATV